MRKTNSLLGLLLGVASALSLAPIFPKKSSGYTLFSAIVISNKPLGARRNRLDSLIMYHAGPFYVPACLSIDTGDPFFTHLKLGEEYSAKVCYYHNVFGLPIKTSVKFVDENLSPRPVIRHEKSD